MTAINDLGHGAVGTREQSFTSILPPDHPGYQTRKLVALAASMKGTPSDEAADGPDPEENIWVPAGYTYFGQFVDHDLTFDSTSTLDPSAASGAQDRVPTNLRTPRFDLDCVYGDGPDAQPFMYGDDGATLLLGGPGLPAHKDADGTQVPTGADFELLRSSNGRAIIGDKRNDENSIVSQIQHGFIAFHNAVVAILNARHASTWNDPSSLFKSAQNEVRWAYQKLILEDFLPRIVKADVRQDLVGKTKRERLGSYAFYKDDIRSNLPREFVAAAYRFGHSGVRTGYRLNPETLLLIFSRTTDNPKATDSLLGFDPLPKLHVIDDWERFFPDSAPGVLPIEDRHQPQVPNPAVRLQFAYKLDPTIVDPLGALPVNVAGTDTIAQAKQAIEPAPLPGDGERPSLALLNLLRANIYRIHGGQEYARLLKTKFPQVQLLDSKHLVVRTSTGVDGMFQFKPIDPALETDTPLWFYVLAEAQAPVVDFVTSKLKDDKQFKKDGTFSDDILLTDDGAKTQLGWVGGRIVSEVFYGLIDSDAESFVNMAPVGWTSMLGPNARLKTLLTFPANVA